MADRLACQRCLGCRQLANTEDAEPWSAWANLPPGSDLAVRMGVVQPVPCPECHGTGEQGWVYAGPDAELVNKLLADPHRNDHILQLTDTGWTLKHPLGERADGDLFDCTLGAQEDLMRAEWDDDGNAEGRYVVQLEGDEESPSLSLQRIGDVAPERVED